MQTHFLYVCTFLLSLFRLNYCVHVYKERFLSVVKGLRLYSLCVRVCDGYQRSGPHTSSDFPVGPTCCVPPSFICRLHLSLHIARSISLYLIWDASAWILLFFFLNAQWNILLPPSLASVGEQSWSCKQIRWYPDRTAKLGRVCSKNMNQWKTDFCLKEMRQERKQMCFPLWGVELGLQLSIICMID